LAEKVDFQKDIFPRMKQMARDSFRAAYGKIDPARRENAFEIFGLDFMIDESYHAWLIEVNTNPCLELSSPLLARLIPSMLENAFR
jgi:tubulin monoglycylase TTLL3/8